MAGVNRIVAHVKFFLLNSCTLSRTEKFIWPSYAIFMAKELESHGEFRSFSILETHLPARQMSPWGTGGHPLWCLSGQVGRRGDARSGRGISVGPCGPCGPSCQLRREVCTCGAMWSWSTAFIICAREPWRKMCKLCWNMLKLYWQSYISDFTYFGLFGGDSLGACM